MKLIKIGDAYLNLSAVVKITTKTVKIKGTPKNVAGLHLANGKMVYLSESDLKRVLELTGNDEPPEFEPAEMPGGSYSH